MIETTLPDDLDMDDDGYPSDAVLATIPLADAIEDGPRWLTETMPVLWFNIPCASVEIVTRPDETELTFSTGGWSGAEDFMGAVLSNPILNAMYYARWRRGGHHTFVVPRPTP